MATPLPTLPGLELPPPLALSIWLATGQCLGGLDGVATSNGLTLSLF